MRVQVLLLVFCAVAHGAPRKTRSLLGGYGAPAPPSPPPPSTPTQSYLPPDQSAPPAPFPSFPAPSPEVIPEQPEALYSPPGISAPAPVQPVQDFAAPTPVEPVQDFAASAPFEPVQDFAAPAPVEPVQDFAAPAPVQPVQDFAAPAPFEPVQDFAAPAPVQPVQDFAAPAPFELVQDFAAPTPVEPAQDYLPPVPAPAPAPFPAPVPAPVVDQSYLPPGKTSEVGEESSEESAESSEESAESSEESAESSEETTGDVVNLSSAQSIEGKTLSDGNIQSLLTQEVNAHVSGGSTQVKTGSNQGYSYNAPPQSCQAGETLNSNGVCEKVTINTNYYLFDVPEAPEQPLPPTQTAEKRLHYNVLFVRVPTQSQKIQNVNLSRDEEKTLVYVVRDPPKGSQSLPAPVTEAYKPESPAVFYVTPGAKDSSEEVEHTGYGNTPDLPSPPTQGYSYNPPSGF